MTDTQEILQKKGISASTLKNLAYIFMVVDHLGYSLIANYYASWGLDCNNEPVYVLCRLIGRLSFPIFTYLLVEGFYKTHSKPRYLIRLLVFAFLSEIPYNIFSSGKIINATSKNVMFDLTISFAILWAVDYCRQFYKERKSFNYLLSSLIIVSGIALEVVLGCDYSVISIGLVFAFYLFGADIRKLCPIVAVCLFAGEILHFVLGRIVSSGWNSLDPGYMNKVLSYAYNELFGLIALAFILRYNGQKGRCVNKYIYYFVYPLQFLILYALAKALF